MRVLVLILASLVTMAVLPGCSDADDDNGSAPGDGGAVLSITEALAAAPADVTVDGYVIETGGEVLLAEALAESFPPQPGGAVLVLDGVDPTELDGSTTQGDTTWVEVRHRASGSIEGEVLTVTAIEPTG